MAQFLRGDPYVTVFADPVVRDARQPRLSRCAAAAGGIQPQEHRMLDQYFRISGENIGAQVQRMALLLDDLLDVSRITRGRLSLKTEAFDMRSVVDTAIEVARPIIDAKKQTRHLSFPKERLTISVGPLRLSQSLSNLLTNAAKYAGAYGSIELTVELAQEELKISVKDNRMGLDATAIPGLFEIFSQLASAIDRSERGLGIGLALVKALIALRGGRVEAASDGLGMGSEFAIRRPNSIIVPNATPPEPPSAVVAGAAQRRQCKVLVADVNRDAADSMAMLLELDGCSSGSHPQRGARIAGRIPTRVILLDIGVHDLNGYDRARQIRQHPVRVMRLPPS